MQNLHTHTTFDDGENTPEEMVLAAMAAGLTSLGFSSHSPLPFENDWALPSEEAARQYRAEVARLRTVYRGQIEIFCGLEYDIISVSPLEDYDYAIGSIHFLPPEGGACDSVDETPTITAEQLARRYGGDSDRAAADYYAQYAAIAENPKLDIVGHFDLLTKFDEANHFYHADSLAYREAALAALERLARADKIIEINTGAIDKGFCTAPYPAPFLLRRLRELGGRILISSDAHSAETVTAQFAEAAALARECGFREIWMLTGDGFVPHPL
ncbi:MAG: histidinol-phosphatase HisJ family protein [Oscillospiraceae bacterium]|nr:histidinol-phosphatase HisJ family protein [Oscillospiraceae bacterium]